MHLRPEFAEGLARAHKQAVGAGTRQCSVNLIAVLHRFGLDAEPVKPQGSAVVQQQGFGHCIQRLGVAVNPAGSAFLYQGLQLLGLCAGLACQGLSGSTWARDGFKQLGIADVTALAGEQADADVSLRLPGLFGQMGQQAQMAGAQTT